SRIAVDQQQIGPGPRGDLTEPRAFVRVTLPGKPEQAGVSRRHHLEHLNVGEIATETGHHLALTLRTFRFEEKVGSPRHLDSMFLRRLVNLIGTRTDLSILLR